MAAQDSSLLALDVGTVRIGVARASEAARLAAPLVTLANDASFPDRLLALIETETASKLIVGLPRDLQGQDTPQTAYVRQFVAGLETQLSVPVIWQDEALTSQKAEQELRARGTLYGKADIDSLAATYILEDYLRAQR